MMKAEESPHRRQTYIPGRESTGVRCVSHVHSTDMRNGRAMGERKSREGCGECGWWMGVRLSENG